MLTGRPSAAARNKRIDWRKDARDAKEKFRYSNVHFGEYSLTPFAVTRFDISTEEEKDQIPPHVTLCFASSR